MQNQEIELAIVGSGELRLKEKFKSLEVSPEKWGKMREDQRKRALEKVHGVPLDQLSTPAVENITMFLGTSVEPKDPLTYSILIHFLREHGTGIGRQQTVHYTIIGVRYQ